MITTSLLYETKVVALHCIVDDLFEVEGIVAKVQRKTKDEPYVRFSKEYMGKTIKYDYSHANETNYKVVISWVIA